MIYRTLLPALLLAPHLLWAAQPESTMSGRCIRIAMADASVARVGLNQPAKGPWYRLSDLTEFILDFPTADTFTVVTDYCPNLRANVTVTYDAEQGKVKLLSEDFSVDILLSFTGKDSGCAEIVRHEAGNTRYFRGATFTVQNEAVIWEKPFKSANSEAWFAMQTRLAEVPLPFTTAASPGSEMYCVRPSWMKFHSFGRY